MGTFLTRLDICGTPLLYGALVGCILARTWESKMEIPVEKGAYSA